ncbi:ferredoxin reductase-like protein [Hesseltinella vesiculosa]|uniref:NADH-cytochrome b5 reductase n=1 Tax=Hesseltinella vesiculosa TaxID=101127 RepID=A0A1X2GGA0_9FUNG|nr:ferredoxin reductase-like protein [Hesseltinella vesiculosa]
MRFLSSSITGAVRASTNTSRLMTNVARPSLRNYSTETKKSGGNGLVLGALAAAGLAGGIYYNQSSAKHAAASSEPPKAAFDAAQFKPFTLEKVEEITHDTSLFRFKLDSADHVSGLHAASCVITRYPITKKDGTPGFVIRPYTPTSTEETKGYVDFIVKVYPDGKMSKHIHNLKVGETLDIKGPIPKYNWDEKPVQHVGMIAGGTGITPMLQVIRRVFDPISKNDNTKVTLIFGNRTEDDIILKKELDGYAKAFPDRFRVIYALDKAPENWDGIKGYVTKEDIQKNLPGPETPSSMIFVCGPDPLLVTYAGPKTKDKQQGEVAGILKELGYDSSNVYKF